MRGRRELSGLRVGMRVALLATEVESILANGMLVTKIEILQTGTQDNGIGERICETRSTENKIIENGMTRIGMMVKEIIWLIGKVLVTTPQDERMNRDGVGGGRGGEVQTGQ